MAFGVVPDNGVEVDYFGINIIISSKSV